MYPHPNNEKKQLLNIFVLVSRMYQKAYARLLVLPSELIEIPFSSSIPCLSKMFFMNTSYLLPGMLGS